MHGDRPRILIAEPDDFSPAALVILNEVADISLEAWSADRLREAFELFDVFWFRLGWRIGPEVLAEPLRCRYLAVPATGLDHIDLATCSERGVRVLSLKGETEFLRTVRATAELTIALMLGVMRHLPAASDHVRDGGWNRDLFRGSELHGKRIGLVGMGRLGSLVAGYLKAFGAEVVGFDCRTDFPVETAERASSLEELLGVCDCVSVHLTYDASTKGFIGQKEFAAMKSGSVFINTSRGGIVDEPSLIQALESGHLAGAGIDVVSREPLVDSSHCLVQFARRHRNLLITPHIGGNTVESFEKTEVFLAKRLVQSLRSTKS
jgi:D-3-phosphoglycerate dehydrogenase / 2-oxoglutarate reductase